MYIFNFQSFASVLRRLQKTPRSASRSVWASSSASSRRRRASAATRKRGRPSTGRTSCSPCPRWASTCTWSRWSSTCRSSARWDTNEGTTETQTSWDCLIEVFHLKRWFFSYVCVQVVCLQVWQKRSFIPAGLDVVLPDWFQSNNCSKVTQFW